VCEPDLIKIQHRTLFDKHTVIDSGAAAAVLPPRAVESKYAGTTFDKRGWFKGQQWSTAADGCGENTTH
jgi:hypothetical protein